MSKRKCIRCIFALAMVMLLSGCSERLAGIEYAQNRILSNDSIRENWVEPREATALIAYRQSGMVGKSAEMIYNYLEEMATNLFMPINLIWKDEQTSGWEALVFSQAMMEADRQFLMLYTPEMMYEELAAGVDVLAKFSPIAMLAKERLCLVVAADSPHYSVEDIKVAAQKEPISIGGLSVVGGIDELRLRRLIGLDETDYDYRSVDVRIPIKALSDHSVEVLCLPEPLLKDAAEAGTIRVIRVCEHEAEEHCLDTNWLCLLAPKNTPSLRIDYWRQTFHDFSGSMFWKKTCADEGWICAYMYGEELGAFLGQEKQALSELLTE